MYSMGHKRWTLHHQNTRYMEEKTMTETTRKKIVVWEDDEMIDWTELHIIRASLDLKLHRFDGLEKHHAFLVDNGLIPGVSETENPSYFLGDKELEFVNYLHKVVTEAVSFTEKARIPGRKYGTKNQTHMFFCADVNPCIAVGAAIETYKNMDEALDEYGPYNALRIKNEDGSYVIIVPLIDYSMSTAYTHMTRLDVSADNVVTKRHDPIPLGGPFSRLI